MFLWQLLAASFEFCWDTFDPFKQILPETNWFRNRFFYTLQLIFIEGISVHRTDALTLSSLSDPINKIKRNRYCEAYLTRPLLYVLVVTRIYDQPFFFLWVYVFDSFYSTEFGQSDIKLSNLLSSNCLQELHCKTEHWVFHDLHGTALQLFKMLPIFLHI